MLLSVFYQHIMDAARQENIPAAEAFRLARAMGYTMVEMDFDALEADPSIPALLEETGFSVSSIYCFFKFDQLHDEARIRALIDRALQLHAARVMPIPGFFHAETEEGRGAELERMIASMDVLTRMAKDAGLTVTIEDYDSADSPIRSSVFMNRFLERIPDLCATYDAGNFRFSAEPEEDAFAALSGRIAHVHLKDRCLSPEYGDHPLIAMNGVSLYPCPVGSGVVPMGWILDQLAGLGYQGVLTVEHFGCRDILAAMKQSAEYIKERWKA